MSKGEKKKKIRLEIVEDDLNPPDSSNSSKETGNTNQSLSPVVLAKKQVSCKKYWLGTLNNWTEEEYQDIISVNSSIVPCLVINKEIGEECGTPHLQIFLVFDEKRRPIGLFKSKRIKWIGKSKDSTPLQCKQYCSKLMTRAEGTVPYCRGWTSKFIYTMILRQWQQRIVAMVDEVPDDRTIHWFWEADGGFGKSVLQKWLCCNRPGCLILAGKKADMKFGVCSYSNNNDGMLPRTILINIPRCDINKISYAGMEEVKDMCFFSSKYEGSMVVGPSPHIFVFANDPPVTEKLSSGRWNVIELGVGNWLL